MSWSCRPRPSSPIEQGFHSRDRLSVRQTWASLWGISLQRVRGFARQTCLSAGLMISRPAEKTSEARGPLLSGLGVDPLADRPPGGPRVSIYACDVHGSRIRGPLDAIYLTLVQGGRRDSRRLRVCPNDHAELLAKYSAEWFLASDEGAGELAAMCGACQQPLERPADAVTFFGTSYRKGHDPDEYYGQYCGSCAEDFRQTFRLEQK